MSKDFDSDRYRRAERDRSFKIGGQEFTYRASVAPEVMADWNEAVTGEKTLGEREWLALYDQTIQRLLEPGQEEKWLEARREDAELPISLTDLSGLMQWLIEEQSTRPSGPPSESSVPDGGSGTTSTDVSSPREAEVSAA